MVRLYEAGTDRLCGTLTDRQFEVLAEALEEDDLEDGDCPIDRETIETLEEQGVEGEVLEVLRLALGDRAEAGVPLRAQLTQKAPRVIRSQSWPARSTIASTSSASA